MLSFNGARITRCSDNAIIYNKVIPQEVIRPIYEAVKNILDWTLSLIRIK